LLLGQHLSCSSLTAIRRRRVRDAERLARWGAEERAIGGDLDAEINEDSEADPGAASPTASDTASDDWPPRKPDPKLWRRR
jgi:hypothetical protein